MNDFKKSRTSVYGDYDKDGAPDLFLVNGNEPIYLFQNNQNTGHNWLIVDLEPNQRVWITESATVVSTETPAAPTPDDLRLESYPNPFSNEVYLDIASPGTTNRGVLEIFDILGRRVFEQPLPPAYSGQVQWNGTDLNNIEVPSGVYMARITLNESQSAHRILVKR